MALDTVQDYVTTARTLLQDTVDSPYRYTNAELVMALNLAFMEVRRLRPDLVRNYLSSNLPSFSETAMNAPVPLDAAYRPAILYYIAGHAQVRDDESQQDARATVFLNKFTAQMLMIQA
jgi:hypothetical protein